MAARFLRRVVTERIGGGRPSAPRAVGAALLVGGAAGTVTYRLLRHRS